MSKINLGITLGDPGGVGPEIVARLLKRKKLFNACVPHIVGSSYPFFSCLKRQKTKFRICTAGQATEIVFPWGKAFLHDPDPRLAEGIAIGRVSNTNGLVAWKSLLSAMKLIEKKVIEGIVTGPVSKEAVANHSPSFRGQTEFFIKHSGAPHALMYFWSRKFSVALQTRHIPLKRVAASLNENDLIRSIRLIRDSGKMLGCLRPRIAVCGLNPHAGENGLIGREDSDIVAPAVKKARSFGIDVVGPISADTVFWHARKGQYDVVLSLYHDQGLAPFKMLAFEDGVQVTLGLPFVRTSPDHGPAFDLAGTSEASSKSFWEAILLAARMINRKKHFRF